MRMTVILCLLLAACTPIHDQVLVLPDAWTGGRSVTVNEREIYRDPNVILTARPMMLTRRDQVAHGVMINLRHRDSNGPQIDRVTSDGRALAYRALDWMMTHCIDGCQPAEVGFIAMSEQDFRAAALTGLALRVWGKRGRAEATVPAEAFQKVILGQSGST